MTEICVNLRNPYEAGRPGERGVRSSRTQAFRAALSAFFRPRPVLFLPLLIPCLLFLFEAAYFIRTFSAESDLQRSDLIVTFEGRPERTREACRLIDENYAPCLTVSPASERRLYSLKRRYLPEKSFSAIPERRARTTLENAVYTRRIMQEHDLRSVILVTSWEHMPRSAFLLRLACAGSGIRIRTQAAATGRIDGSNWYRYKVGWKMVYNEMLELWGSLLEYANYRINGTLPSRPPGEFGLLGRMKKCLLFKIDSRAADSQVLAIH